MNKSSQVKPEQLIKICSMDRLFQLADMKKSVWWTPIKQLRPAAFFQNWNARNLRNNLVYGNIMEVDTSIVCAEFDEEPLMTVPCEFFSCDKDKPCPVHGNVKELK